MNCYPSLPFTILPSYGRSLENASTSLSARAVARLPEIGRCCIPAGTVLRVLVASLMLVGTVSAAEPGEKWVRDVGLANALVETGDLDQAQAAYTRALHDAQSAGDDVRSAIVLQNMGRLHYLGGQLREAERAYLQAAHTLNKAGVTDDRLFARAYIGLPAVYIQTGQYSKAETLIRRVLSEYPAGADSDKASLMGTLGVILAHKRRFEEAEQVLQATAQQCASTPDPEMQEVGAIARANIAGLQMHDGRLSKAIDSYRHAVALMEGLPAPSPTTLAITLADYAKAVRGTGDVQAAENLYRKAIAVAKTRLGQGHVILAELFQQYAQVVRDRGMKSEARKLVEAARQIRSEWNRVNMTGHTVEFESLLIRR